MAKSLSDKLKKPDPNADEKIWQWYYTSVQIRRYMDVTGLSRDEMAEAMQIKAGIQPFLYHNKRYQPATREHMAQFHKINRAPHPKAAGEMPEHGRILNYVPIITGSEYTDFELELKEKVKDLEKEIKDLEREMSEKDIEIRTLRSLIKQD